MNATQDPQKHVDVIVIIRISIPKHDRLFPALSADFFESAGLNWLLENHDFFFRKKLKHSLGKKRGRDPDQIGQTASSQSPFSQFRNVEPIIDHLENIFGPPPQYGFFGFGRWAEWRAKRNYPSNIAFLSVSQAQSCQWVSQEKSKNGATKRNSARVKSSVNTFGPQGCPFGWQAFGFKHFGCQGAEGVRCRSFKGNADADHNIRLSPLRLACYQEFFLFQLLASESASRFP